MPKHFCIECGDVVLNTRRCSKHPAKVYAKRQKSLTYKQRKFREKAVSDHIQMHGYICGGYKRKPHFSTDLTADHPIPTSKGGDQYQMLIVLCRSCNSSKQATI